MFNYEQLLPNLDDLIIRKAPANTGGSELSSKLDLISNSNSKALSSSSSSSQSPSASASSSSSSSSFSPASQQQTGQHLPTCPVYQRRLKQTQEESALVPSERLSKGSASSQQLFTLPPVVTNSSLVKQRASVKDSLAVATVTTGASLPLMIGGRSKCVLNLLEDSPQAQRSHQQPQQIYGKLLPATATSSCQSTTAPALATAGVSSASTVSCGPKNTALRAEQRKQNVVSVVRPVVNHHHISQQHAYLVEPTNLSPDSSRRKHSTATTGSGEYESAAIAGDNNSFACWSEEGKSYNDTDCSVIDEFMELDRRATQSLSSSVRNRGVSCDGLDELLLSNRLGAQLNLGVPNHHHHNHQQQQQFRHKSEQELKQEMILFEREEFELNRNIRRQHKFVLLKIEERRRNLQIIQSVWVQKDFKHAIEKLVDLYHQGLVFTRETDASGDNKHTRNGSVSKQGHAMATQLSSMNTSLVVDVIGVIVLRPRLWSLEICQLILPIIVNDLLLQKPTTRYENYTEVGLKALKLILTHFSSVIRATLESQKDSAKLLVGVDLSREDRINKCLNCYKFLLEASSIISKRQTNTNSGQQQQQQHKQQTSKLNSLYRDLQQSFASFQASFEPNQSISLFTNRRRPQQ